MNEKVTSIPELFGSMVFTQEQMRQRLPARVYNAWQQCLVQGTSLDRSIADEIASAMKDWAIEKGATHYTHWFQPMTGFTAEKHDGFITPHGPTGVLMELSGKELSRGEADASSFPSGGLRATFEARGYTAWDPTAYAFVKDKTLYIPTIFCSYGGETLDKKTPLLRSMKLLDTQSIRILRLFGNTQAQHVTAQVGPEQEYFLIDKEMYRRREDLVLCGRTLFGAKPPKGQELDDHYYGAIKPRVAEFMHELDQELWKVGVPAKTEHNEVAPAQHEVAQVYSDANSSCDHNQLTMEFLKKVADRHGLVCLLHEKPFAGINGSGKHDNWSLATDTGENLLKPGKTPSQNAQFLLFLAAFIKGVDEYQDMLRCCVSYPGNDHRLGGNEAPPAIISVFLGDELTAILDSIISGQEYVDKAKRKLAIGVDTLPEIPRTPQTGTAPLPWPLPATSSSSVCWARPSPSPAPTWCSTPSWPRSWRNLRTSWSSPTTSRRTCRICCTTPSRLTSASSSTATAMGRIGCRRPSAGGSATCGTPWTACPPILTPRTSVCSPDTIFSVRRKCAPGTRSTWRITARSRPSRRPLCGTWSCGASCRQ